ncbi:MAG: hypothetical protein V4581_01105 [Bacteroidota bacterium]
MDSDKTPSNNPRKKQQYKNAVTVVVTRRVPQDKEHEFRAKIEEIVNAYWQDK